MDNELSDLENQELYLVEPNGSSVRRWNWTPPETTDSEVDTTGSRYLYDLGPPPGDSEENDIFWDDNWDATYNLDVREDFNEGQDTIELLHDDGHVTVAWTYDRDNLEEMYAADIKIKNVIANQPIRRGGS